MQVLRGLNANDSLDLVEIDKKVNKNRLWTDLGMRDKNMTLIEKNLKYTVCFVILYLLSFRK